MHKLYEVKGTLMPCCNKSHIRHSFFIEEELESLHIQLEYDRSGLAEEEAKRQVIDCINTDAVAYSQADIKRMKEEWRRFKDINNLLTLSLDDSNGFRGAGHRGTSFERVSICKDSASYGYFAGAIPKGNVTVVISVHALVKDCNYHLIVETDG